MTLANALTEINATIEAIPGLTELPDQRVDHLKNAGIDNLDGVFIARVDAPVPWPEMSQEPTSWHSPMRVEIGHVKLQSEKNLAISLDSRVRLIVKALRYAILTNSTLWDFSDPVMETASLNPDVRIATVNMRIRYEE